MSGTAAGRPSTDTGRELVRLAESVAVDLEPDGGGPFVKVAVLAVELLRNDVPAIEAEAVAAFAAELAAAVEGLLSLDELHMGDGRVAVWPELVSRAAVLALIRERKVTP